MPTELEIVLRFALRFSDLSLDVARNRDDGAFKREGGRTHFVIDANIFEIFLDPNDHRGQGSSLHAQVWPTGRSNLNIEKRQALGAQTGLLTVEYLLSGDLERVFGGQIFLSDGHSWELARRVKQLTRDHAIKPDRTALTAQLMKIIARLSTISRSGSGGGPDGVLASSGDQALDADLAEISDSGLSVPPEREALARNRLLLQWLCEAANPFTTTHQLVRLLSTPFRKRLAVLHHKFPPSEGAAAQIKTDAERWYRELVGECELRGIPIVRHRLGRTRRGRSLGALWDDAKTLAMVRWVAVHRMDPDERLVFVTADDVLFDVYRKWHAKLPPTSAEFAEPFILRRIFQYAPIFNMFDASTSLGDDVSAFFKRLEEAVEVALLPLNLMIAGSGNVRLGKKQRDRELGVRSAVLPRMREETALRLLDAERRPISKDIAYAGFVASVKNAGIEQYEEKLYLILEDWRRLERVMLGTCEDYVQKRLAEFERELPGIASGEVSMSSISQYIDRLIRNLYEGSLAFSLPLAKQTIREFHSDTGAADSRVPIGFHIITSTGESIELFGPSGNLEAILHELRDNQEAGALESEVDLLFGVAACVALASQDWNNADHFAEMAGRGLMLEGSAEGAPAVLPGRQFELSYLNALTKRCRIGTLGPVRNADNLARIRRIYREARALLDACAEHYGEGPPPGRNPLAYYRALSERAALGLFVVAAFARAVRLAALSLDIDSDRKAEEQAGLAPEIAQEIQAEAEAALSGAEEDLRRCYELLVLIETAGGAPRGQLHQLREQSALNTMAACVLRKLLLPDSNPLSAFDEELLARVEREAIDEWAASAESRSSMLSLEVWTFLHMRGRPEARDMLAEKRQVSHRWTLSLDAALFKAIDDLRWVPDFFARRRG